MEENISLYNKILIPIRGEDLIEKYSFSEINIEDLKKFESIQEFLDISESEIKNTLDNERNIFTEKNGFWDINIFKQYDIWLQSFKSELEGYSNKILSRKVLSWHPKSKSGKRLFDNVLSGPAFYLFEFQSLKHSGSYQIMLITSMTLPKLQWRISKILKVIDKFLNEDLYETVNTKKATSKFTNNFDSITPEKVYQHFHQMVKKKWLKQEEFHKFLKSAFEDQVPPAQKFNIKNSPTKETVTRLFYSYYSEVAGKPHGKKIRYVKLLGEYFKGYNSDTLKTNFSR